MGKYSTIKKEIKAINGSLNTSFKLFTEGYRVTKDEIYTAVEVLKENEFIYLRRINKPYKCKIRAPDFSFATMDYNKGHVGRCTCCTGSLDSFER